MADNDPHTDVSTDNPADAFADISVAGMLQDMVLESADVEDFLSNLARLAAERLSSPDTEVLAAVTLLRPRSKITVASSDEHAQEMDKIQYAFDDGPCLRAAREQKTHTVVDFRTETRFGGYPEAITDHGILSAVGVPIPLDGDASAALNLYALNPQHFTPEDIAEAEVLARQASTSLRTAVRIAEITDTSDHLKAAMNSRTIIDVAAGIIMGQNRCSHDTAITILKAASNGRNVKLNAIALGVVESLGQGIPDTHFAD